MTLWQLADLAGIVFGAIGVLVAFYSRRPRLNMCGAVVVLASFVMFHFTQERRERLQAERHADCKSRGGDQVLDGQCVKVTVVR